MTWCVWNSSASLLRDVTMRILCGADFLSFQWVGGGKLGWFTVIAEMLF